MGAFQIRNEITCRKCNKKVPIETMTIDKYGEMMVCSDCGKQQFQREPKRKVTKEGSVIMMKPEKGSLSYSNLNIMPRKEKEKEILSMPQELTAYKCTYCGFEFKRRKAFPFNGSCPYCNKKKVAKDPIKSGQWIDKLWT